MCDVKGEYDQPRPLYWGYATDELLDDYKSTKIVVLGDYKQGKCLIVSMGLSLISSSSIIVSLLSLLLHCHLTYCLWKGKTFVLNGLANILLRDPNPMEGIKFKKAKWIGANKQELEYMLVDTAGLNHLPEGTITCGNLSDINHVSLDGTNKEQLTKRVYFDKLIQDVSVRLADLLILVSDKPRYCYYVI